MRPTKTTLGASSDIPIDSTTSVPVSGLNSSGSMPFLTTCSLAGSRSVYDSRIPVFMPSLTLITASAASNAVRSAHDESR